MDSKTPVEDKAISLQTWIDKRLRVLLDDDAVTEIAVNGAGGYWYALRGEWRWHADTAITPNDWMNFARYVATYSTKPLNEQNPCLSAYLPHGERVEIGIPPQCDRNTVVVNIRKHSKAVFPFQKFIDEGYFEGTRHITSALLSNEQRAAITKSMSPDELELYELAASGDWPLFLRKAVEEKQNLVIAGATGTGKTAFMRSLIEFIPMHERLGVSQDVDELQLPNHPNTIKRYFKTPGAQSGASVEDTMMAFMRSSPSRLIQSEIRGPEAFFYLMSVLNSGHPGGLTTVHANSPRDAFLRLALLVKSSEQGRGLELEEIKQMLAQLVNVICQLVLVPGKGRSVPSIYYDPMRAIAAAD